MKRLAIITTHPIQYNAPWIKLLNERGNIGVKVFYTWGEEGFQKKYDPGFHQTIEWDIPLLDGYDFTVVKNISKKPGSHHFKGIDNPGIINEITQWNPDAILVIGWCFKSHLKLMRHFKGKKKILFRGDSTLLDEAPGFSIKKIIRRVFLKWVYRHVDKALYVGTANKEYYEAHGLKNNQLLFAPHAIDNNRFASQVQVNQREAFGIPTDAVVFLFAGKFEPKKDPQLLLNSFIRLKDSTTHLLMVGSGELEQLLKINASKQPSEISNRIHFLPFQNQANMPSIYQLGDVLVLPSRGPGETWGLSVNEAMACSKAVLVSDKCGCAADLVIQGVNGLVFKSNDGNDLLKKMEIMLSGQHNIPEMGKRSLQVIQSWRFEKICQAVEESMG